jgi:hypothetical protein
VDSIYAFLKELPEIHSIESLSKYIKRYIPSKYRKKQAKYPHIPFRISADDIHELVKTGWINGDHELNPDKFVDADAITQLLFSIVWKQGDLLKVARIVDGIVGKKAGENSDYITFLEFGRYLQDPGGRVIIDQHVIRAYRIIVYSEQEKQFLAPDELKRIAKKHTIKESDRELVEDFRKWVETTPLWNPLRSEPDWRSAVDDFLFAFGKMVKDEWK